MLSMATGCGNCRRICKPRANDAASIGDYIKTRFRASTARRARLRRGDRHMASVPAGSAYISHHMFEVNGETGAWGHAIGGMGAISDASARRWPMAHRSN
jgi:phytoene dehydrogenase-like protein